MSGADGTLDIGEVVRRSGLPTSTLHLWERHGLIEPTGRSGLRRIYRPEVLETISIIVQCQRAGFTLAEIGALLEPDAFATGKHQLEAKLAELRERRQQLDAAITGLEHALACTAPSPLECATFTSRLLDVLPVNRTETAPPPAATPPR